MRLGLPGKRDKPFCSGDVTLQGAGKLHKHHQFGKLLCGCFVVMLLRNEAGYAASGQVLTLEQSTEHDAEVETLPAQQWFREPDGSIRVLKVETVGHGPSNPTLALPSGNILWMGLYPGSLISMGKQGVQMIREPGSAVPKIKDLVPLSKRSFTLPLPSGLNVVHHLDWTGFGVEERAVAVEPSDAPISWSFRAGKSPAGLYSAAPWRLPRLSAEGTWRLEMEAKGEGNFLVGISSQDKQGFGEPVPLGTWNLGETAQRQSWKIPARLVLSPGMRVTLMPLGETPASIALSVVAWLPPGNKMATSRPANKRLPELGVWNWSADPQEWDTLRPLWQKAGVRTLQLALPKDLEKDGRVVRSLGSLQAAGFKVVAVEGDPHMVLPNALEPTLKRHQELLSLKQRPTGILNAIQYDVEPYLLPGFRLHPAQWMGPWLEFFEKVTKTSPLPVEAVVPFWLIAQEQAQGLVQGLAKCVSRVVVMNYQSDPVEAAAWANAWLEWSVSQRVPISLAMECGEIRDEKTGVLRPAPEGELWISPWPGIGAAAVLFDQPVRAVGDAYTCAFSHQNITRGSRTTFRGRPDDAASLLYAIDELTRQWNLPEKLRPHLLLHEPEQSLLLKLAR